MDRLFKDLESNQTQKVEDAKDQFRKQFNTSKEAWLVNGLVDYFLASNSLRAIDVLVIIREPHDKYLFDRVAETLRSSSTRLGALTLLGHIVQRQPTWLYKIVHHPTLMKDLLKILKTESDMVEVISALLVLNILLPIIPGLIGSHLSDIFEVFSRLAAWNSDCPRQLTSSHVLHLQVALYALFYQLYGIFPCTFLGYLKQEYNIKCDSVNACNVFQHTIKPMIETVRLHPFLIMSSTEEERCTERWKKSEHHAVVFNCTRFLLDGTSDTLRPMYLTGVDTALPSLESSKPVEAADFTVPSSPHSSYLNGVETPRFSLCAHLAPSDHPETTPTSIPNTPLYKLYSSSLSFSQQEGSSPPEAAIEATPETTPVKDIRPRGRAHTASSGRPLSTSSAVCALTDFASPPDPLSRKHGGADTTSPLPQPSSPSLLRARDMFSFPPLSGVGGERKPPLSRLVDERLAAQELALQTNSSGDRKSSAPSSPLTVAPPTSTHDSYLLDDSRDSELQHNSSDHSKLRASDLASLSIGGDGVDGFPDEPCSGGEGGPLEGGCTLDGMHIHMPDMLWFKKHRTQRTRYQTECTMPTSQSLGLSSPRDVYPPLDSRVRRTLSCPEMKKSGGGGSLTGSVGSTGLPLPLPEEQETEETGVLAICTLEDAATQTEDIPPSQASYEHLFLGLFPATFSYHHTHSVHTHHHHHYGSPPPNEDPSSPPYQSGHSVEPCCLRGRDLEGSNSLIPGANLSTDSEIRFYKEQVALMNLQLHFERHRRQVHLERNRRLLGKSRNNRASEEHNSALRDQVCLLQKDIERSSEEMRELTAERRPQVESQEKTISRLKAENAQLHRDMAKCKTRCETLEQETKSEHENRSILNQILHETKAKLFDSNNEMEHYKAAILENKRLNNDLSYLQKEIIILGEMNSKYKDILSYLAQMKNEYAYSALFNEAYLHQIESLHQLTESQAKHLESTRSQNVKLEAQLAEKEKTIGQFKLLFSTVKHRYQEELEAMTSRYNSVQASLTRQRTEQLELYYQFDLNRKRLAKLSKHPGPGPDKAVPLAAQGPPIPSSSRPHPNNLLSLSRLIVTEPALSTPAEPQNSALLEE